MLMCLVLLCSSVLFYAVILHVRGGATGYAQTELFDDGGVVLEFLFSSPFFLLQIYSATLFPCNLSPKI